jgi:hypothetical protein
VAPCEVTDLGTLDVVIPTLDLDADTNQNGIVDGTPEEDKAETNAPGSIVLIDCDQDSKKGELDNTKSSFTASGATWEKVKEDFNELIEEHRDWRFVLTGSSARKLRRGGVDLMAGRALWCEMHPYMAAELGVDFDLDRALALGMVPMVHEAENPAEVLKAYAGLYLQEEVQAGGLVRNLSDFARFLEVASFSHGQVVNISNIARECHVERTTVAGFMDILVDLLLAFRLPVFAKRAQRAVVVHPKFYYFDAGVFRSLRPTGPLDRGGDIDGAALEGLLPSTFAPGLPMVTVTPICTTGVPGRDRKWIS